MKIGDDIKHCETKHGNNTRRRKGRKKQEEEQCQDNLLKGKRLMRVR